MSKPYCKVTNCSRLTFRDSNYCYQHKEQEESSVNENETIGYVRADVSVERCSVKDCFRAQYKEDLCHYHYCKSEEILNFDKKSGKSKSELWKPTQLEWMLIPFLIIMDYGYEEGKWASKRFFQILLCIFIVTFLLSPSHGVAYGLIAVIFVIVGWMLLIFFVGGIFAASVGAADSHPGVSNISENNNSDFYKSGTVYTCINGHQISSYGITSKCPFCGKTMSPEY